MTAAYLVAVLGLLVAFAFLPTILRKLYRDRTTLHDYDAELLVWQRLETTGVPVLARVEQLSRDPLRMTRAGSFGNNEVAAVQLRLAFEDASRASRVVTVSTFVETELLANFSAGRDVAIVHDPVDPDVVAIDRRRSPTEMPSLRG